MKGETQPIPRLSFRAYKDWVTRRLLTEREIRRTEKSCRLNRARHEEAWAGDRERMQLWVQQAARLARNLAAGMIAQESGTTLLSYGYPTAYFVAAIDLRKS